MHVCLVMVLCVVLYCIVYCIVTKPTTNHKRLYALYTNHLICPSKDYFPLPHTTVQ